MRITDLLKACSIELNGAPDDEGGDDPGDGRSHGQREEISRITDKYMKGVFAREEEGTTGIGEGIAIPHAKNDAVRAPGLAAMVIRNGVDYDSMDGEPVNLVVSDRRAGYGRQRASGSTQQAVYAPDGRIV